MSDRTPDAQSGTAARVRGLARRAVTAALSTLDHETGAPFGSLILVATLPDGSPVTLLSQLAAHTRNLNANPSASLLFDGTGGYEDPLAGPRAALSGRLTPTEEPAARSRFLARHPSAAAYVDFGDFAFYRLEIDRCHLVAGFGRIEQVDGQALLLPADATGMLAASEHDILGHMNDEHADAVQLYATKLCGAEGGDWSMVGIDPEGFDLARGGTRLRVAFDGPVRDADGARHALVALVKQARSVS